MYLKVRKMQRKTNDLRPLKGMEGDPLNDQSSRDEPEGQGISNAESFRHLACHFRPWGYGQFIPLPSRRPDDMM